MKNVCLSLPSRLGLSLHELFVFVSRWWAFAVVVQAYKYRLRFPEAQKPLGHELLFISARPLRADGNTEKVINGYHVHTHFHSNTDLPSSATQHHRECARPGEHLAYLVLLSGTTGKCMNELNNRSISKLINIPRTRTLDEHHRYFGLRNLSSGESQELDHFHSSYFHFHHSPSHWRASHSALTVMHWWVGTSLMSAKFYTSHRNWVVSSSPLND